MPLDYLPLVFRRKFNKISAPSPNTNNQIAMHLGMLHGIFKFRNIKKIQLQLLSAKRNKILYQLTKFCRSLRRFENAMT